MSLTMTTEEREAFLADVHVAVISVAEHGHGPLVVPIWYSYEPGGEVRIITGRTSRKGKLLERDRRPLARRYLGTEVGDSYIENTRDMAGNVLVRMRPERWLTVDYAKQNETR
jgi:hypothetical protein